MSGSGEIGAGSVVECVDGSPGFRWGTPGLSRGAVYRVVEVTDRAPDTCPKCGSNIGVRVNIMDHNWCSHRFKPIGGDHSSISSLIRENAPAAPELEPA